MKINIGMTGFIAGFIMVIGGSSLYAMEYEANLLSQQLSSTSVILTNNSAPNNYGSLTHTTFDNIHEQQLKLPDDEQRESILSQLSKKIEIGGKCGAGFFIGMAIMETVIGTCLGYGFTLACVPVVFVSTAATAGGACLCTSCFCSDKHPCTLCGCSE